MAVIIPIQTKYSGKGFDQAKREAERAQREFLAQESRMRKLQEQLNRAVAAEQKAEVKGRARLEQQAAAKEIQMRKLQAANEKAVAAELRADIKQRQQLLRLTAKLEKNITREEQQQIRATKDQIAQRQRLNNLSKSLDDKLKSDRAARMQQFTSAVGAGVAALTALAAAGAKAVQMANIQAQAEAQLEARIRSTGGAAGFTAEEGKQLAASLQKVTNIGDEVTISGEAMLLSFTSIGKETVPRATKALLDLATAMNNGATPSMEQLKTEAIVLGKILNDPDESEAALQRQGIKLTETQKQQIKTFTEMNDIAGAQAVVLAEVEREFGGSAEAARKADGGFQALGNSFGDLQEGLGFLIKDFNEASHATENLIVFVDQLTRGAQAWRDVADDLRVISRALQILNEEQSRTEQVTNQFTDAFTFMGVNIGKPIHFIKDLVFNHDALTEAMVQAGQEMESENAVLGANTEALADNADASDEAAKRLEKVTELRKSTASKLLDIDQQTQEKTAEEWDKFFEQEAQDWKSHNDKIADLNKKSGQDLTKIADDLAKDLEKSSRDLQKNLAKIDKNEAKQIDELKKKTVDDQRHEEQRRRIDALADQRLFNFELRNLAAEGNANQIKEALERRAIEEQIAKEKAQVESQIQDEKQRNEIDKIKQAAQEQRDEARTTAAEHEQELRDEAEAEKQIREEKLKAELQEESDHYAQQIEERRKYREEKLNEIETEKQESIKKLASELAESRDLTESELRKLATSAGELGKEAGISFAEGMKSGLDKLKRISEILGEPADFTSPAGAGAGASAGISHPGAVPGFQRGGSFVVPGHGGPDSQTVRFRATPGERVTVGGGGPQVVVDLRGAQFGSNLSSADLEQFGSQIAQTIIDEVLVPKFARG